MPVPYPPRNYEWVSLMEASFGRLDNRRLNHEAKKRPIRKDQVASVAPRFLSKEFRAYKRSGRPRCNALRSALPVFSCACLAFKFLPSAVYRYRRSLMIEVSNRVLLPSNVLLRFRPESLPGFIKNALNRSGWTFRGKPAARTLYSILCRLR